MPWITVTYQIPADKLETLNEFVNNLISEDKAMASESSHTWFNKPNEVGSDSASSTPPASYQEYENFRQALLQQTSSSKSYNRRSQSKIRPKKLRPKVKVPPRIIAG